MDRFFVFCAFFVVEYELWGCRAGLSLLSVKRPAGLEDGFWREIRSYEEQTKMDYIMSIERKAIEQGVRQEAQRQLLRVLNHRFGAAVTPALAQTLQTLPVAELENLVDAALDARSFAAFMQAMPAADEPGAQPSAV